MDVLLNWLEQRANYKKDRQAIQDAMNSTPNTSLVVNKSSSTQSRQGWNPPRSNLQGKYSNNYLKQPSLRELIEEQAKINDNISKKLVANDKILEEINAKMDAFSSAIKDQLIYNKKIESQLARLSAVLPVATNPEQVYNVTTRGGRSTRDPPFPKGTSRVPTTPAPATISEEDKDDEVEEVVPQEQEMTQNFYDANVLP